MPPMFTPLASVSLHKTTEATNMEDSDRVIIKVMVVSRDPQLNMGSGPHILHITKALSLAELKCAICEQKNLQTDVTLVQIQTPLNECPGFYPKTNRDCFYKKGETFNKKFSVNGNFVNCIYITINPPVHRPLLTKIYSSESVY
jgi:hypothetical protein